MSEMERTADRIIVMGKGQVLQMALSLTSIVGGSTKPRCWSAARNRTLSQFSSETPARESSKQTTADSRFWGWKEPLLGTSQQAPGSRCTNYDPSTAPWKTHTNNSSPKKPRLAPSTRRKATDDQHTTTGAPVNDALRSHRITFIGCVRSELLKLLSVRSILVTLLACIPVSLLLRPSSVHPPKQK
ncbi:hypothetical protein [Arthrobacter methylotrophus]|uniref:hypothetical protein n=1 Tax=Arthrobacter methylotrophus TaxID=121291 RepID=UPI0031E8E924